MTTNNNFKAGQNITFASIKTATFLNGQTITVASASATQFTASFSHADYAAADSGTVVFLAAVPTPPPTPGPPPTEDCSNSMPALPAVGADGYYPSYTIDVTRKISANIQHLMALLGAAGLKGATEVTSTPAPSAVHALLGFKGARSLAPPPAKSCYKSDALFGGGTVDVAYRPSDISIASAMKTGVGGHEISVAIDKNSYVVDNEGRYYVDFSVPIAIKGLSQVQYQATGNVFSPTNTSSAATWFAVDFFFPASDVKSQTWTRYPHPLAGVAFAKQPLHNILLAGAWGPSFSEVFMGVAWVNQPRVGPGSNSCSATNGSAAPTTNSFGSHFCPQFTIGLNMAVTAISNKLGAPR